MAEEKREVVLMKGNEAIAHAAIRCGCDGYFGYPITPQRWCRLRASWHLFIWCMVLLALVNVP